MGVTGLWTVLQPCARPIKIETLNKKRLAVDASIWIYQFLKAVRDKEGNALRNSHVVGFFRRICKLLFIGIKPVFVFDGGAPALKRQTISGRKARREGRREDAARTAGKLLAIQLQRAAEDDAKKRKEAPPQQVQQQQEQEQEQIPETLVYADEVLQSQQERTQNRTFRKKDQYHLPDLGMSLSEMGGPNDPRVMSLEELEDYARQFDRGEDINVYDFSKIDFDGYFFQSLPPADRYNILNAARLRSRLRMGYSKEQLDSMFPDRMAFSKFQIERVRERNDLTQRLMNLNGMNDDSPFGAGAGRVAGEKGREYVLVKNDGVEGGWALGVVTNKDEGKAHKPIDVDLPIRPVEEDIYGEDDDDFEDVPIEGLNRLPKPKPGLSAQERDGREYISNELAKRRRKFYNSRQDGSTRPRPRKPSPVEQDPDSLFLAEENEDAEWEDVQMNEASAISEEAGDDLENEQLQQAIALSMQQGDLDVVEESEDDPIREVFQQERVKDTNPFAKTKGSGLAIARLANQRSSKLAPKGPFEGSDSEEDGIDLQAALAESRKSKRPTEPRPQLHKPMTKPPAPIVKPASKSTNASGFDGPLPFEKLNLGNSLLGKKKMEKIEQDSAGGFEKSHTHEKKTAEPLPPWFSGERDINQELARQRQNEKQDWEEARKEHEAQFQYQTIPRLQKQGTREIIDLDASASQSQSQSQKGNQVIVLDSEDEEDAEKMDVSVLDTQPSMSDLADKIRAEPPQPAVEDQKVPTSQDPGLMLVEEEEDDDPVDWSESENESEIGARAQGETVKTAEELPLERERSSSMEFEDVPMQIESVPGSKPSKSPSPEFEDVPMNTETTFAPAPSKSPSPEFEDVPLHTVAAERPRRPRREPSPGMLEGPDDLEIPIVPHSGIADDNTAFQIPGDDSDQYSDADDAELFASLAAEGEEHARFAKELNNNTTARVDFDAELKQLRAQQKKDRRDADEVTQTMVAECQHLLTLFGLPYVTAPMEAEAQCAELVHLGLVDGIVTDDSDTFLFGGTRVYKNMFNAAKFVECYLAQDLTSEFGLTRDKLIAIAQLLGSDYTSGIPGIGPVTALEVLSEFPDLEDFKTWWAGVQDTSIPKAADAASPFRRRFRRSQATKLFLPTMFPDPRVADAYLNPEVDNDPEPFQWGVPDLAALRTYLSEQIGWSWERTDEVLVPVIRDMNRREKEGTQSNITRFFEGSVGAGAFAPRAAARGRGRGRGSRLGAALSRLAEGKGNAEADVEADAEAVSVPATRAKRKGKGKGKVVPAERESDEEDDGGDDELYEEPKKKKSRKK
ncbi:PIN domain-like protein [Dothidotthia symphoricarpi CBS 119687]|uniref:PIN domain-like protein n=1 Tax=Dothidotthia symphoricarpi CBS 119687 TaxID=1392245 RepID=A0A6A6AJ94_9PLEO|nr:PIN domain-like protein [Dothidotthia symphoricarpi CBS 119687]KAF2132009.1 PIN domain-like protein [Dothidotthia symphoricarpi CBS 119687]